MKYEGTRMLIIYYLENKRWSDAIQEIESLPERKDGESCLAGLVNENTVSEFKKDRSENFSEIMQLVQLKELFTNNSINGSLQKDSVADSIRTLIEKCLQGNRYKNARMGADLLNKLGELELDEVGEETVNNSK